MVKNKIKNKNKVDFSPNYLDLIKNKIKLTQLIQLSNNQIRKDNKRKETKEIKNNTNNFKRVTLDPKIRNKKIKKWVIREVI